MFYMLLKIKLFDTNYSFVFFLLRNWFVLSRHTCWCVPTNNCHWENSISCSENSASVFSNAGFRYFNFPWQTVGNRWCNGCSPNVVNTIVFFTNIWKLWTPSKIKTARESWDMRWEYLRIVNDDTSQFLMQLHLIGTIYNFMHMFTTLYYFGIEWEIYYALFTQSRALALIHLHHGSIADDDEPSCLTQTQTKRSTNKSQPSNS